MMVLYYYKNGNLNYYLTKPEEDTVKMYNI
jgi:hypothetical protein